MTNQRTYVFVPLTANDEECLVFFGGKFAYHAPYNDVFMEDVTKQNVVGVREKSKYSGR